MLHPYFAGFGSRRGERPMILGHRGAAGCAPENTLFSFECCIDHGGDAIESDVQVTGDGTPVLLHDADLRRVSGVSAVAESLPLSALEEIDAGHHFTIDDRGRTEPEDEGAFRDQGHRIPTVEAAFEAFPDARFNLEIKTGRADTVAKMVELVARYERADRTLLTAGDDGIMRVLREELAKRGVDAATSASLADIVAVIRSAQAGTAPPLEIDALQIPTDFGNEPLVTPALLEHAHRHGVHVHVWTINEAQEMERLLDLGVDGIVTDFPGRMRDVLAARTAR
jgi:glycerophosphoryl diester phosphodiesterase